MTLFIISTAESYEVMMLSGWNCTAAIYSGTDRRISTLASRLAECGPSLLFRESSGGTLTGRDSCCRAMMTPSSVAAVTGREVLLDAVERVVPAGRERVRHAREDLTGEQRSAAGEEGVG